MMPYKQAIAYSLCGVGKEEKICDARKSWSVTVAHWGHVSDAIFDGLEG